LQQQQQNQQQHNTHLLAHGENRLENQKKAK
jgi:hypothetical protein